MTSKIPTVLLEDLLSGRRLAGGDWQPALMCARVSVAERDARAMRAALDTDAGRGVLGAVLADMTAQPWPLRAVSALAGGLGTRDGDDAARRLAAEADARGEAPLGPRAQRLADGMAAAAAGRRAVIEMAEAARAAGYDAAFDEFHGQAPARGTVVSLDASRAQVRRPSGLER
jgi:hypothetical protein